MGLNMFSVALLKTDCSKLSEEIKDFKIHLSFKLQLFQAEMFSRQQILHSIIVDGQHLLEQGQVDDR